MGYFTRIRTGCLAAAAALTAGCGPDAAELADRLDRFALPEAYEEVSGAAQVPPPDASDYAWRRWQPPADSNPCADLARAFDAWAPSWTDEPVERYDDSRGCTFVVTADDVVGRGNVDPERSRVLVETYRSEDPPFA